MSTWIIEIEGPKLRDLETNLPIPNLVEHEGILSLDAGDLTIVRDGIPVIGYARGQWLRFERKEA